MSKLEPIQFKMKDGRVGLLRSLVPGDAAEILAVARTVFEKCGQYTLTELHEFTYTVEQEAEIIQKHLDHPDKVMMAPEVDGRLVGLLNFSPGARRRNSHQGEFKWAATTPNIETVRLRVHEKNQGAHALYAKLGFVEEGREVRGVRFAEGQYDNVISMAFDVKNTSC